MNIKKRFFKSIFLGLFLVLGISCQNKPSGVITISDEEIRTMIPEEFSIHHEYQVILVNDTVKLRYDQNQFLMKDQLPEDNNEYLSISDTVSERILRRFQVMEIEPNQYKIKFDLIDLASDEIPSMFGGNNNKNFVSRPFSLVSYKSNHLAEEEKEKLKKYLFRAFE